MYTKAEKLCSTLLFHIFFQSCTLNPTEIQLFCDIYVSANFLRVFIYFYASSERDNSNFNSEVILPPSVQAGRALRL